MVRPIQILPVLNGYICTVGCQQVVFQDRKQMLTEIGKYYQNPEATEKRYIKDAINKMDQNPCVPQACNTACEPQGLAARR
jgi:hypothetical protein